MRIRPTTELICPTCLKAFLCPTYLLNRKKRNHHKRYCSRECGYVGNSAKILCNCRECNKEITKQPSDFKQGKNVFCGKSCATTFNNKNKTHGTRRSKLEQWLENQLTILYPSLEIHYNKKDAINSELDFYIPSLKLAFELNGVFHYEPIFGPEKLLKIQNNDNRKFQACLEKQIELCIIDSSKLVYFKVEKAKYFLKIMTDIINEKLD